jgi:hypothetical protein
MEENASGLKLLNAVERMIDAPEEIEGLVAKLTKETPPGIEHLSERIISHYSNRSALAGAVSSLPGMIPGVGTLAVALGTTLLEMAAVLKLEVEMCMALAHAHGFDIRSRTERQLSLLLGAVHTHEVEAGRNILVDIGVVSGTALWNYTPRELHKLALRAFSALAIGWASTYVTKGILHAIPLLGIGIGAGVNKTLTTRVGRNARSWLSFRASVTGVRR